MNERLQSIDWDRSRKERNWDETWKSRKDDRVPRERKTGICLISTFGILLSILLVILAMTWDTISQPHPVIADYGSKELVDLFLVGRQSTGVAPSPQTVQQRKSRTYDDARRPSPSYRSHCWNKGPSRSFSFSFDTPVYAQIIGICYIHEDLGDGEQMAPKSVRVWGESLDAITHLSRFVMPPPSQISHKKAVLLAQIQYDVNSSFMEQNFTLPREAASQEIRRIVFEVIDGWGDRTICLHALRAYGFVSTHSTDRIHV
jgi:hypothetical protein